MFFSRPTTDQLSPFILNPVIKKRRLLFLFIVAVLVWFGFQKVKSTIVTPEAVLVLGGHEERERFAAQFAKQHPQLPIWVSSGSPQDYARQIFINQGISRDRLHLDYQALDTVTNFTTLVEELQRRKIESVYLVTSANHMTRARIVGEIVFGSRGISLKPIAVPSNNPPEPIEKTLRDGVRAIIWLATGHTGAILIHSWRKNLYLGITD